MSTKDHNQGQTDASNNKYQEPYSLGAQLLDFLNPLVSPDQFREKLERNEDYRDGHGHTTTQKK